MYKSKKNIANGIYKILKKDLDLFLSKNLSINSKSFKRRVFLGKLPKCICDRKDSRLNRLRCFWIAIDILKHEKKYKIHSKNNKEFEVRGLSKNGKLVFIHVREETDNHKDKKLFFVSCYYDHKKSPSPSLTGQAL